MNPGPLHWEQGVLAIGPPGKSPSSTISDGLIIPSTIHKVQNNSKKNKPLSYHRTWATGIPVAFSAHLLDKTLTTRFFSGMASLPLKCGGVICQVRASQVALVVKNLPASTGDIRDTGDMGSIPGLGRSPGEGNGNPLQYSCLGTPRDRRACQATIDEVTKSRTRLSTQELLCQIK